MRHNNLGEKIVDAAFAHATGIRQLAGFGRVKHLIDWRNYDRCRDASLYRVTVPFGQIQILVEIADVYLHDDKSRVNQRGA